MCACKDGWMDGWMRGWEGGRMDGWIGGWMNGWKDYGWRGECVCMYGCPFL